MYCCPRCKAEVPPEALYCKRCGFNATNARLKVQKSASNGSNRPVMPQPERQPSPVQANVPQTAPPLMPTPVRNIQPAIKRVMHSGNGINPPTPIPSSTPLPNDARQPVPATPPVITPPAPPVPIAPPKVHPNPTVPTRPVPSHTQQTMPVHFTPAHLLAMPPSMPSTPPNHFQPNLAASTESFVATSYAAERWRTSWRNKQRLEAGPATEVSRGHSSVPEPLMAMQYSLARIRAIVKPQQGKQRISVFWISVALLACLIIGLGTFILSTYSGSSTESDAVYTPPTNSPPALTVKDSPEATIQVGQILHVHGDNFDAGDPIIFLLDGANSISGTNGKEIAIQVSNQGTFDMDLPVATSWTAGPHVIEAEDNQTGQTAYLSIQVGPTTLTAANTSSGLSLSQSHLNFQAYIGQGKPAEQFITLTNTSGTLLTWTAKATTDDGLNWLAVDTATTSGNINPGGTANVGIKAILGTLKSNALPYTGDILFTVNGKTQLIMPVKLLVQNSAEWIFSPNPVIGVLSPQGGTCQPNAALTFINLGNVPVFWHIILGNSATSYVHFMLNGKTHMQGVLAPSGQNGDTQVLTLVCNNVQIGTSYPFTIVANNIKWNDSVLIQAA